MIINAFIDGLHEELIDFTRLSKSATLLEAYQAAQQQQQAKGFYDEINRYMSHKANFVRTKTNYSNAIAAKTMIDHYNEKALDAFIRGLA